MTRTRFLVGMGYSYLSFGFYWPFVKRERSQDFVVMFGPEKPGA